MWQRVGYIGRQQPVPSPHKCLKLKPFKLSDSTHGCFKLQELPKYKLKSKEITTGGEPSSPYDGQPPRDFRFDPRLEPMASPLSSLLQLLQFPDVTRETSAVLNALLSRCADEQNLSTYVLDCIDERLRAQNQKFGLDELESYAYWHPLACVLLRMQFVGLVADALNSEATRWITDFLLIAIGKRQHRHKTSPSHPSVRPEFPEKRLPARRKFEDIQDQHVQLRDGPRCSVSGSRYSVICSQLIPVSDDITRLARFRVLARVFFQAELPSLSNDQLQSTGNALMLSVYWKDRLDKGRLFFRCIDGDFHAIPVCRDDSDALAEERQANGLEGPTILDLHGEANAYLYSLLNPQIAWVHRVITTTWLETGLGKGLINDMDLLETLPKEMQSMPMLGQRQFSSFLRHRLMLM